MKQAFTPVLGLPQLNAWSQVFSTSAQNFVLGLSVSGNDAPNVGAELLEFLQEVDCKGAEDFYRLLEKLIVKSQDKGVSLSLAGIFYEGQKTYFAALGAEILLKREVKVGTLLKAGGQLKLITGDVLPGDVLVLISQQAQYFSGEIKLKLENGYEVDSIVSSLVPGVHDHPQAANCFALFFHDEAKEPSKPVQPDSFELESEPEPELEFEPKTKALNPKKFTIDFVRIFKKTKVILLGLLALIIKFFKFLFNKNELYINSQVKRKKILVVTISSILLIIIIIGINYLFLQNRSKRRAELAVYLDPIQAELQTAKDLQSQEPIKARQIVSDKLEEFEVLNQKFVGDKYLLKIIDKTQQEAQQFYEEISGKEEFSQLPEFFDLRLKVDDFIASKAVLQNTQAVFLDEGKKELISLKMDSKQSQSFSLSDLGEIRDLQLKDQEVIILADGLWSLNLDSGELTKLIEAADSNKEANLLGIFGEYFYVFNPQKRNIYRYPKTEDGYGDPIGWLVDKQELDFASVTQMQIDGDLWLLTQAGEILKFSKGYKADFQVRGLETPITQGASLLTNENFKNLYVLDPNNQRLLVLAKSGEFLQEIKSQMLSSTRILLVDEAASKAWAVSGSLLYELGF